MMKRLIAVKVTLTAIPVFFLAIAIELMVVKFFAKSGSLNAKDDGVSIFMGLFSVITNGAAVFDGWHALLGGILPLSFATLVACFVLDDLRYYVHHRIAHRCRWPWAMHIIHHSSQRFSFAVALRKGWTKHFTGTTVLKVPLVLVGFDPLMVIFCGALNAVYQFFLHTETVDKMPRWFEAVLTAMMEQYLDANYAGTLIIWDKLFAHLSRRMSMTAPIMVTDFTHYNPFKIFIHEYWGIVKDMRPGLPRRRLRRPVGAMTVRAKDINAEPPVAAHLASNKLCWPV